MVLQQQKHLSMFLVKLEQKRPKKLEWSTFSGKQIHWVSLIYFVQKIQTSYFTLDELHVICVLQLYIFLSIIYKDTLRPLFLTETYDA